MQHMNCLLLPAIEMICLRCKHQRYEVHSIKLNTEIFIQISMDLESDGILLNLKWHYCWIKVLQSKQRCFKAESWGINKKPITKLIFLQFQR